MLDLHRILVPIDFSEHSRAALVLAKETAERFGAELDLLHAVDQQVFPVYYGAMAVPPADQLPGLLVKTEEALHAEMADAPGPEVPYRVHAVAGHAALQVTEFAETHGNDLIVLGTHGLRGLQRLLMGSTAERILRTAPCPVLTTRDFRAAEVEHQAVA